MYKLLYNYKLVISPTRFKISIEKTLKANISKRRIWQKDVENIIWNRPPKIPIQIEK
jgi:hypothetical protein